jgi:hypothetical protein
MIEGRHAERQARERALVYRLGATNKVTKRIKQKNLSKTTHNNQPKTAAATKGTMDGRRDELEARGKWGTIILMAL